MRSGEAENVGKVRGHMAKAHSQLAEVVRDTVRLWRKHHLDYDQSKYVVERVRHELNLEPPRERARTVERLDHAEVERVIQAGYRMRSQVGLMVKTLFLTGARVREFVQLRVEDVHLDGDLPQIHIVHAKRQSDRYVPILPSLAQELCTYLNGRRRGYLFESNRHDRYSVRGVQTLVTKCARAAGLDKRVYPHLLRHSIATILLDAGMPLDQVQKFLGHLQISTTQIYAATSVSALGESYHKALEKRR